MLVGGGGVAGVAAVVAGAVAVDAAAAVGFGG